MAAYRELDGQTAAERRSFRQARQLSGTEQNAGPVQQVSRASHDNAPTIMSFSSTIQLHIVPSQAMVKVYLGLI